MTLVIETIFCQTIDFSNTSLKPGKIFEFQVNARFYRLQ